MSKRPRAKGAGRPETSARDEKRARRLERQLQEARERRRRDRRRWIFRAGLAATGLVVTAGALALLLRPDPEIAGVQRPADRGRGHVADPRFSSSTPTSGKHLEEAPRCSSFPEPLAPGLAVHALEHGVVVVWYRPDDDELRDGLEELSAGWDSHVVLSPNRDLPSPIVATAWNRLGRYDRVDGDVRRFIDTYRRRGPEQVACDAA